MKIVGGTCLDMTRWTGSETLPSIWYILSDESSGKCGEWRSSWGEATPLFCI